MGTKIIFSVILMTLFFGLKSSAQNCDRQIKRGLLKGKSYVAECDSMIVLDKKTYEGFYNKIFFYEAIMQNQDQLDSLMRIESIAKDSLIKNLDAKISVQGRAIEEYRSKIDTLYAISEKSFALNDTAIKALEKEKKKSKLGKIGFFAAGGVCLFLMGMMVVGF